MREAKLSEGIALVGVGNAIASQSSLSNTILCVLPFVRRLQPQHNILSWHSHCNQQVRGLQLRQ